MNIKDILSDKQSLSVPLFKTDNYSNIYKKTEKITCAVFLVTDDIQHKGQYKDIASDVRRSAKDMLVAVIGLLSTSIEEGGGETLSQVIRSASTLRSLLFVLVASRALRSDLVDVLAREVDGVMQNVNLMYQEEAGLRTLAAGEGVPEYVQEERRRTRANYAVAPRTGAVGASRTVPKVTTVREASRRDSILTVIRERGVVSIKDISEAVTDCSEKTIQRELIGLIKDNAILKEGERRWSKYRLVQQ